MRKRIIIIGLLLISLCAIPFVIYSLQFFALYQGEGGGGDVDTDPSTEYTIIAPTLGSIYPNPSDDGNIRLSWDNAESINSGLPSDLEFLYYRIYKRKDSGTWKEIKVYDMEYYHDYNLAEGTYEYKVQSVFYKPTEAHRSEFSNIQSVVVGLIEYPSNPSIIINNGAETTNSFEVILTLSCDNADEMQFQFSFGVWTDWVDYSTTYIITLLENDLNYPDYRIGVVFRNGDGTTEDAGYGDIYDDITYTPEEIPPIPPEPLEKEEVDYMWVYILLGILIGLVGIGIFLKYRKRIIKSN